MPFKILTVSALLIISITSAVSAQEASKLDVAGGFAVMNDGVLAERDGAFPFGWGVSVGVRTYGRLSMVGQLGGNYKSAEDLGLTSSIHVHTFLVGARLSSQRRAVFVPFVQMLVGAARVSTDVVITFAKVEDITVNEFLAFQPGAGGDFSVWDHIGVRIEGDYRVVRTGGVSISSLHEPQFVIGIVFHP